MQEVTKAVTPVKNSRKCTFKVNGYGISADSFCLAVQRETTAEKVNLLPRLLNSFIKVVEVGTYS